MTLTCICQWTNGVACQSKGLSGVAELCLIKQDPRLHWGQGWGVLTIKLILQCLSVTIHGTNKG